MLKRLNFRQATQFWKYFLFLPALIPTFLINGLLSRMLVEVLYANEPGGLPLYAAVTGTLVIFILVWTLTTIIELIFIVFYFFRKMLLKQKLRILSVNVGFLVLPYVLFLSYLMVRDFQDMQLKTNFLNSVQINEMTYTPFDANQDGVNDSISVNLTVTATRDIQNAFMFIRTSCAQLDAPPGRGEVWITNARDPFTEKRLTLLRGTHVYNKVLQYTQSPTSNPALYAFPPKQSLELQMGVSGQEIFPPLQKTQETDLIPLQFERLNALGSSCSMQGLNK